MSRRFSSAVIRQRLTRRSSDVKADARLDEHIFYLVSSSTYIGRAFNLLNVINCAACINYEIRVGIVAVGYQVAFNAEILYGSSCLRRFFPACQPGEITVTSGTGDSVFQHFRYFRRLLRPIKLSSFQCLTNAQRYLYR